MITWRGHTFGDSDDEIVEEFDRGAHELRSELSALPYDDGAVAGRALAGTRTITVDLFVSRTSRAAAEDAAEAWTARMQPLVSPEPLTWTLVEDGRTRTAFVLPDPLLVKWMPNPIEFRARARWVAPDPVLYGATEQTLVLEPYTGTAFADYPASEEYPKLYGSGGSGGGKNATNGGTYPVWPRFEISGPTTGLVSPLALENVTTGQAIRFDGLTVGTDQTLIVDTHPARRIVAFSTGAARVSTVVNLDAWWRLVAGDNELRFRAGGSTDGATCTVVWRDGFL